MSHEEETEHTLSLEVLSPYDSSDNYSRPCIWGICDRACMVNVVANFIDGGREVTYLKMNVVPLTCSFVRLAVPFDMISAMSRPYLLVRQRLQ